VKKLSATDAARRFSDLLDALSRAAKPSSWSGTDAR